MPGFGLKPGAQSVCGAGTSLKRSRSRIDAGGGDAHCTPSLGPQSQFVLRHTLLFFSPLPKAVQHCKQAPVTTSGLVHRLRCFLEKEEILNGISASPSAQVYAHLVVRAPPVTWDMALWKSPPHFKVVSSAILKEQTHFYMCSQKTQKSY